MNKTIEKLLACENKEQIRKWIFDHVRTLTCARKISLDAIDDPASEQYALRIENSIKDTLSDELYQYTKVKRTQELDGDLLFKSRVLFIEEEDDGQLQS